MKGKSGSITLEVNNEIVGTHTGTITLKKVRDIKAKALLERSDDPDVRLITITVRIEGEAPDLYMISYGQKRWRKF